MSELSDLRTGIRVPEYGVVVPWKCTPAQLYDAIPRRRFEACAHGDTLLTFTLLGYRAAYWFNFVAETDTLREVQLYRWRPNRRAIRPEYRRSAAALRSALGAGEVREVGDGQLWRREGVTVRNDAGPGRRRGDLRWGYRHVLSVDVFHASAFALSHQGFCENLGSSEATKLR
ncbi:hypothetical protein J5226_04910 [Lysobacter sp. K5869]|uniref:hypothetical protein n=1 Tax=Lysobacter sp. K5869 TaxID=2820808 RepID=UPI001C062E28|nr:hypothetical protein [Lysobacter sp. K5869]QWP77758.1 hypothetical protein J5226_04910 [Lysobacter sp. K5869]